MPQDTNADRPAAYATGRCHPDILPARQFAHSALEQIAATARCFPADPPVQGNPDDDVSQLLPRAQRARAKL